MGKEQNIRFIYASSAATYGDGTLGFSDDHSKISKLKPINMYGYSKQLFDLWVLRNSWKTKLPASNFSMSSAPMNTTKKI